MPPSDPPKLSIMTFPQQWDGSSLSLAVLLLPNGNPLAPLFPPDGAPFAGTPVALSLIMQPGLDAPFDFDGAAKVSLPVLPVPEHAVDLFNYFRNEAGITIQSNLDKTIRKNRLVQWGPVQKVLPESYQLAAGAVNPNTPGVISEKEYACNLRGQERAVKKPTVEEMNTLSWGQVISYVLKQPRLARQMGLIYDFNTGLIPDLAAVNLQALFKNGGRVYVTLDPAMAHIPTKWPTDSPAVSSFGARLPRLTAAARRIFAAVLFPSDDKDLQALRDDINREAREYDDGFTAIVHCRQPEKADAVTEYGEHLPAASEAGIQIGWDDEQVMTWLNRQLDNALRSLNNPDDLVKAPLGVAGYRIDVRQEGETDWKSLCGVQLKKDARSKALQKVTLTPEEIEKIQPTSAGTFGDLTLEEKEKIQPLFPGEFNVDTTPIRPYGVVEAMMHLPRYFANWRGNSLVVPDEDAIKLTNPKQTKPTDSQPTDSQPKPSDWQAVLAWDAPIPGEPQLQVPLLHYGQTYEFRVRLADLTGGGPSADDTPVNPALAPVATQEFRRHVPPKSMIVQKVQKLNQERLMIRRPLLGYPELMYADVNNTYYSAAMIEELANNMAFQKAKGYGVGIPDPDVTQVSLRVQVRAPRHDRGGTQLRRDGEFIELYEVRYELPDLEGFPFTSQVFTEEPGFQVNLKYLECQDIEVDAKTMEEAAADGTLRIPRGRDVRLRLAAVSQAGHFAKSLQSPKDKGLTYGLVSYVSLRREEMDPIGVLFDAGVKPQEKACAILLQPANPQGAVKADPVQLVATALGLEAKGVTLTARPGQRVVFGASERLRHSLAHGNSEITFASKDELYHHWVIALIIRLNRDWTWDGLKDRIKEDQDIEAETHHGIEFKRSLLGNAPAEVGRISIPQTLGEMATQPLAEQERSYTRIIFLDAIDPNPASLGEVPPYLKPQWECKAYLKDGPDWEISPDPGMQPTDLQKAVTLDLRSLELPIAVPPVDLPKIAAAGIARPDYLKPAEDYATTEPMPRSLWIEFEKPLKINKDNGLKYFCRVLGYGPDPLITPQPTWGFAGVPDSTEEFSGWKALFRQWFGSTPEQWFGSTPEPPPLPLDPEEIRVIRPGQDQDSAGYDAMLEMIPAAETEPAEGEKDWLQPTKGVIGLLQPIGVKHWLLPLPPGVPPDSPELFGFWTYEIRIGYGRNVWSTAQARFGRPLQATGVQHPPPQIACTAYRSAGEETLVWLNPEALTSKLAEEAKLNAEILAKLASEMAAPLSPAGNRDLLESAVKLKNLTEDGPLAGALGSNLLGMGPGRIMPAKPFVPPEDWIKHHLIGGDIVVTAPFALSIIDGKPITYRLTLVPGDDKWAIAQLQTLPPTHLWALLYTQVHQVDGQQKRNLLLTYKPMHFAGDPGKAIADPGQWFGRAIFKRTEVEGQLKSLGLGKEAPLSVLVLELLPNDAAAPKQPKPGLIDMVIPNFEPLGKDLGRQRILRTSPLTQVADRC